MKKNSMVMSNNAFVQQQENRLAGMMGDRPGAPAEMKKFDAFMSNNGEYAMDCAGKITKGIDNAFPVK